MPVFEKIDVAWKAVSNFYHKENGGWVQITPSAFQELRRSVVAVYGGFVGPEHVDEAYNPNEQHAPNINVIYDGTTGKPNVKTDENGAVVKYEWTDTGGGTGHTVSDVDTGVIAFDASKPGFVLHLVAEMTPNENGGKNIIEAFNSDTRRGLYVYTADNYCYKKVQTANYNTNSSFAAWSKFSETGKDNNYYKTRSTITFDVVYTTSKQLSLHINGVEHFSGFSVDDSTFQNLTVKAGVGMTDFTIKELKIERTYE